ncbi:hypothetical protein [Mammaliicoccus sp. JADD-157]|uniref:hypothetical protein n=1 Tax=Mammaliicoccus sp. JADD-157 TaxID=3404818 RepID=UPI003BB6FBD8
MLTERDLLHIKETRAQLIKNRTQVITITITNEDGEDPFTGEPISTTVTKEVDSVVTDRTSRVAAERRISDAEEVIEGDIWFSIDVDEFDTEDNPRLITRTIHDGLEYAVVAADPKGIGEMTTRWEFVGKRVK